MSSSYIPKRALFIYAHPDDIEFGVAGTAAKWAKYGCVVQYIVVTDGNIGSHDPDMTKERLAGIRQAEQTAAAHKIGANTPIYLSYPDGMVQPTLELRRDLVREIRRFRPNAIVCGDPTVWFARDTYINHPDHRAVAAAALEACFPAPESPLVFPELLEEGHQPHKPNYVYVSFTNQTPNTYIDTSEVIDLKIEALKCHDSQLKDWDPTERTKTRAADTGKQVGFDYAEAFFRITLKEYEEEAEASE